MSSNESRKKKYEEWVERVFEVTKQRNRSLISQYRAILEGKNEELWKECPDSHGTFEEFVRRRFGISAERFARMGEIVQHFSERQIESLGYDACNQICRLQKGSQEETTIFASIETFEKEHKHPPATYTVEEWVREILDVQDKPEDPPRSTQIQALAKDLKEVRQKFDEERRRKEQLHSENIELKEQLKTHVSTHFKGKGTVGDRTTSKNEAERKHSTNSAKVVEVLKLIASLTDEEFLVVLEEIDEMTGVRKM